MSKGLNSLREAMQKAGISSGTRQSGRGWHYKPTIQITEEQYRATMAPQTKKPLSMPKWKCPTCQLWITKEPISNKCLGCKYGPTK